MKTLTILSTALISMALFNCSDNDLDITKSNPSDPGLERMAADITIAGDGEYEKVITEPLFKTDDCKFIVSGTIEYRLNGELIAVIDYGNGECDDIATKTVDGFTSDISLDKSDWKEKGEQKTNYDKIITVPLVKIEGCNYVVEGTIQYLKDDIVVATIDYGNGVCDEWATKITDAGTTVFSLADKK